MPIPIWNTSSSRPRTLRQPRTGTSKCCSASASAKSGLQIPRSIGSILGDRDVLHITTGGKNVSENRSNMSASSPRPPPAPA